MTDFLSKKMAVSILAMMTLSIFISHASLAKNPSKNFATTKAVALPNLPLSNQAQAFAKKYPHTATAVQIDLFAGNNVAHITNEAYVLNGDKSTNYSPTTLRQLQNCNKNLYTSENLADIFQRLEKYLSSSDFNQLEAFYSSPAGQYYLNSKVMVSEKVKNKKLLDIQNLEDNNLLSDSKYDTEIDNFLATSSARTYELNFLTPKLRQQNIATKQCIGKIIGRDIGEFD